MRFGKSFGLSLLFLACLVLAFSLAWAENDENKGKAEQSPKQQASPPAVVVTAKSSKGEIRPQSEFIGTVYFPEVSEVASEVSGRMNAIRFEEGQSLKKGEVLAVLSTDVAHKELNSALAEHRNVIASLREAQKDLERKQSLFKRNSISESEYDKASFLVTGLKSKASSLAYAVERLKLLIEKAEIKAPFDGVVLERMANTGEWITPGTPVAAMGRNDFMDIVVEVPDSVLAFVSQGMEIESTVGGREIKGEILAVIPRGDVATRTFPIKIRTAQTKGLAQGMEAKVKVPVGQETESVLVPRDAVIQSRGQFMVWIAAEGKAAPIPVRVVGYKSMQAAVVGQGLGPGMDVVIKGNERLRPGQPVAPTPAGDKE